MILNRSSRQVLKEKQKVRGRVLFDNLLCLFFVKQSQMPKKQVSRFKLTGQLYLLCSASLFINSWLRDWSWEDDTISKVKERSATPQVRFSASEQIWKNQSGKLAEQVQGNY